MRYADGGGLTAQGRARREDVRLQTARLFEQGVDADQIAKTLRVSTKSVYLVTAMRHRLHRIQRHTASSADSSARPDSPSSQNPPDTQTLAFQAL
jgi:hypothetical protein